MSRINGEGSWDIYKSGKYTYQRFRIVINGEQKSFYGKTKTEAQKKYKTYLENSSDHSVKSVSTICDIARIAIDSRRDQIKATTYEFYLFGIQRLEKDKIGKYQIQSTTQDELQEYINSLKDTDSMSTIRRQRITLGIAFSYAQDKKIISNNPMLKVKLPNEANVTKEEREPIFLSSEERHMLENESKRLNTSKLHRGKIGTPFYGVSALAIIFILHTGLRIGELCGLQWDCVDMKNRTILIKRNAHKIKNQSTGKYEIEVTTPKRRTSVRKLPLDNYAFDIIEQLLRNVNGDLVFHTKDGKIINRDRVLRTLNQMVKRCEIRKKPTIHDLRHTYASELIRNGIDIKTVSEILGHKDISTTLNIYVHKSEDDLAIVRTALK